MTEAASAHLTAPAIPLTSAMFAGQAVPTVSARELHGFLEVRRKFADWIKDRIDEYGFDEGRDFVVLDLPKLASANPSDGQGGFSPNLGKTLAGGRPRVEYAVALPMAKELAMVERTDRGRQARRYFIECERIALAERTKVAADPVDVERATLATERAKLATRLAGIRKLLPPKPPPPALWKWTPPDWSPVPGGLWVEEAAEQLGLPLDKMAILLRTIGWVYALARRPDGGPDSPVDERVAEGLLKLVLRKDQDGRSRPRGNFRVQITPNGMATLRAIL